MLQDAYFVPIFTFLRTPSQIMEDIMEISKRVGLFFHQKCCFDMFGFAYMFHVREQ